MKFDHIYLCKFWKQSFCSIFSQENYAMSNFIPFADSRCLQLIILCFPVLPIWICYLQIWKKQELEHYSLYFCISFVYYHINLKCSIARKNCFKMSTFGSTDYATYASNITLQHLFGDVFLKNRRVYNTNNNTNMSCISQASHICSSHSSTWWWFSLLVFCNKLTI